MKEQKTEFRKNVVNIKNGTGENSMKKGTIGFIGTGNMAKAIIGGMLEKVQKIRNTKRARIDVRKRTVTETRISVLCRT